MFVFFYHEITKHNNNNNNIHFTIKLVPQQSKEIGKLPLQAAGLFKIAITGGFLKPGGPSNLETLAAQITR